MNKGLVQTVTDWLSHPFNAQGSALSWTLFLGLVIIAAFFWQTVLITMRKEL